MFSSLEELAAIHSGTLALSLFLPCLRLQCSLTHVDMWQRTAINHLLEVAGQGLSLLTTPSMHGAVSSVVSRPSVVSTLTMMLGLADALTTSKTVYFVRHGQVHPASPVHPAVNPLFTLCVEKCSWQAEHNVLIEGGRRDEARRLLDPPLSEVHPATSARQSALACSLHPAAVQAASLLPRFATQHRKDSSRRRRCAGTRSFQRRSMTRPWLSSAPSAGPYRCSFVCLVVVRVCARENVLWPEDSCVVTFVSLRSSVPLLRLLWEGYDPGRTPRRGGASFAIPTFKKPVRFCATRARRSPRSRTCLQKTVAFSIGLLCPTVGNSRRA